MIVWRAATEREASQGKKLCTFRRKITYQEYRARDPHLLRALTHHREARSLVSGVATDDFPVRTHARRNCS